MMDSTITLNDRTRSGASQRITEVLSIYVLPLFICLLSLVALLQLPAHYPSAAGFSLSLQTLPAPYAQTPPSSAIQTALAKQPSELRLSTHDPFWLQFSLPEDFDSTAHDIRFATSPLLGLHCYGTQPEQEELSQLPTSALGSSHGYDLQTNGLAPLGTVYCNVLPSVSGPFSIQNWTSSDWAQASQRYTRYIALLEGGLLTLAALLLVIALLNKQSLYLLVAVWLVGNLRLGAMAMGWDNLWLGHELPATWLPTIRQATLAAYFLVSYTLFTQLLRTVLQPLPFSLLLRALQWGGLALLPAAFLLERSLFMPAMLLLSAIGLLSCVVIVCYGMMHAEQQPAPLSLWHIMLLSASLCVLVLMLLMLLGLSSNFLDTFQSVLALPLSSLMVAILLGERLREERYSRTVAEQTLIANHCISPFGIFTLDENGQFVYANSVFYAFLGLSEHEEIEDYQWEQFFGTTDWEAIIQTSLSGEDTDISRLSAASHPGLPQQFGLRALRTAGVIEGSLQDISKRSETIRKLKQMANHDPITDVLNKRGIEKALSFSLDKVREGNNCILAYLDLNYVKHVNDAYGHAAGDALLKEVSHRIETTLHPGQELGRLGNDEFLILFNDTTPEQAQATAEKIIKSLNQGSIYAGNRSFNLQSAIGLVELSSDTRAEDALAAANRACRDARRTQLPSVLYKQGSTELYQHAEELRLFKELENGASGGLYLEMQPLMALQNPLNSLNVEVLLRVRDSRNNLMPSGKIIAAAEESGTVSIIDKWVFAATLEWLDKHHTQLPRTQQININLSGVSLNDDKFIDELFTILENFDHLANRLCVEITEGVALQDLERTRLFMQRLQHKGVRIALDDFGAGYTSFSYLQELPTDAIKIDGSLIHNMLLKNTNVAIVRTIVELARNLGMVSIAEWVEDVETLHILRDIGVDYVQGFVVSGARSPTEILAARDIRDLVKSPEVLSFIDKHSR
ncbi:putative bifunctional diguanylate cyclase/phosphodiesterase [Paenalcaligenes sp. Me52]|uniref:putative bifunctional diguanylate cyclase/phosphodiesterase n=1 Tax=Paenalcaligenes sp. Me52 TaxID=3392038 RepID=UPI003D2E3FBF